jgi:hypothetical protein
VAFAVAKDHVKQRLVFDMRRCYAQFKPPPGMAMGSPRALSHLDLSAAVLGDDEVCASFGDVECFFYCLRGPAGLREWLWLEGVDFNAFKAAAVREGASEGDFDGCDGVGFTGLPMGWTWAPYLAQGSLEFLLQEAEMPAEGLVLHGRDAPELERGRPLSMPYIDDFLGLRREQSAKKCHDSCEADLARCQRTLAEHGLSCHKDGVGQWVESLGVELSLKKGDRTAKPKRAKFVQLLMATRAAARSPKLSPRQLSALLGHWAWWLMLRPAIFSVLDAVYVFTTVHGLGKRRDSLFQSAQDVPDAVRAELRLLLRLAPFVRADLSWPADSRVYMTDACETSGAACYAKKDLSEVRELQRTSASWERACEPPPAEFCVPAGWRVAARAKWKWDGQIDALEGAALHLGLRHAVRDRGRRGRRMLVYVDNQALLGCARKGRSSAGRLLTVCRRVAGLVLFADLRLYLRYVPTQLNVADAPSRGARAAGCDAWSPLPARLRESSEAACEAKRRWRQARLADLALAQAEREPKQEVATPACFPWPRARLVRLVAPMRRERSTWRGSTGAPCGHFQAGARSCVRRPEPRFRSIGSNGGICHLGHRLVPVPGRRSPALLRDGLASRRMPPPTRHRQRVCRGCGWVPSSGDTTMTCDACEFDLCWICWSHYR